jgi:integrase
MGANMGTSGSKNAGPKRTRRAFNRKLFDEQNVLSIPYKKRQYMIWDGANGRGSEHVQKGLAILVSPNGTKSFRSTYYFPNSPKPKSRHLGRVGEMTLADARKQCADDRANARKGIDPKGEHTKADAYAALVEEYIKRVQIGAKGNVSHAETRRLLLKDTAEWERRAIATITAPEIQRLLEHVRDGDSESGTKGRPYLSNKLHALMSSFFNWCSKPAIGKLKVSPMLGVDKPWNGEKGRDRPWFRGSAADDAIKALWNAARKMDATDGKYLMTVMLTGKRKTAIAEMKWEDIDENWFWHAPQPTKATTNKRLHAIPLPRRLQIILGERRSGYVFPGSRGGRIHVDGHDLQNKVRATSGLNDFFFHGIRHIVETKMAELKIPPHVADLLLDHAPKRGSGKVYNHHHYKEEMLAALETWAACIDRLTTDRAPVAVEKRRRT